MKIKTNQPVLSIKGEPYKVNGTELTLGAVIADALATAEEGGKMKLYLLAQKAYNEETIDLDEADLSLIKKALEKSKAYNNLVIGSTLILLEK